MTKDEYSLWRDVLDTVNEWENEASHYHEDGNYGESLFCIDITFDFDEWGENGEEIDQAIDDLSEEWGFNWDSDCNTYYIAAEFE